MQTIWSRVAQTRGTCKCPQCLSYANGVTRRATASATRRTPKYLTSSTLWYSGIFAAAATFDAGVKKKRREQWDRAIGDLRQELGQPERAREEVLVEERRQDEEQELELEEGLGQAVEVGEEAIAGYEPFGSAAEDGNVFRDVDPEDSKAEWATNTGPPLDTFNLPPQSIYATDERRSQAKLRRWTTKKILTVQGSTEKFLGQLLLELQRRGWSAEAAQAVPENFAQLILQNQGDLEQHYRETCARLRVTKRVDEPYLHPADFNELVDREAGPRREDTQICRFGQDGLGGHHITTRWLNSSLQSLFEQYVKADIQTPTLLAKIAYNLAISSAPPNLETYNTLLLGLSKAQLPTLSNAIIASMNESHIRHNEVTTAAVLDHYIATANDSGFWRYVSLMRGKFGGMALARNDLEINEQNKSRLVRHPDDPEKIIQLPYPTPYVFRAIIEGLIKFSDFDRALRICEYMRHEGWGVSMAGLTPLLKDCADRGDWENGLAIWKKILILKGESTKKTKKAWVSERIGMTAFAAKLRLCLQVGQREVYDAIWEQALKAHGGASAARRLTQLVKEQAAVRKERSNTFDQLPQVVKDEMRGGAVAEKPRVVEERQPVEGSSYTPFQYEDPEAGLEESGYVTTPAAGLEVLRQDVDVLAAAKAEAGEGAHVTALVPTPERQEAKEEATTSTEPIPQPPAPPNESQKKLLRNLPANYRLERDRDMTVGSIGLYG
ncbi:uncharacterized protein LTR77_009332 [Saxophila tyrrhenica]|uniref:Pentatricopeptide repeat protein n=1 Tax=Saxophila tyrrhenica TaxID=1690608 RepID=A0AAV9NYX2_9PEZI|nr:hypothetical protein LTR77_009332 [Saxophila tyrrhenica]